MPYKERLRDWGLFSLKRFEKINNPLSSTKRDGARLFTAVRRRVKRRNSFVTKWK